MSDVSDSISEEQQLAAWKPDTIDRCAVVRLAQWAFDQKKYIAVAKLLESITDVAPEHQLILARALLKVNRLPAAIAALSAGCERAPYDCRLHFFLGCALGHRGDYLSAQKALSRAIELNPHDGPSYVQRGNARLKLHELKAAFADYVKAEELGTTEGLSVGFECVGLLLAKSEIFELAQQALMCAFQRGSRTDVLLYYLGWTSYHLGRFHDCTAAWSLLSGRFPKHEKMRDDLQQAMRMAEDGTVASGSPEDICRAVSAGRFETAADLLNMKAVRRGIRRMEIETARQLTTAVAEVLVMAGRREHAVELYEYLQNSDPSSAEAAHGLFLISYWEIVQLERKDGVAAYDETYRRLNRNTVVLLQHEDFWENWLARREVVYGVDVQRDVSVLRGRLERFLMQRWSLDTAAGLMFRLELQAAASLHELGGIPLMRDAGQSISCGPEMLKHLDCAKPLAELIQSALDDEQRERKGRFYAELHVALYFGQCELPSSFDEQSSQVLQTARYFSQLAEAQVLVEYERPEQALEFLAQSKCERCASETPAASNGELGFFVCREDCDRFAIWNPAYANIHDAGDRLFRDAALLTCEVYFALADRHMTAKSMDFDKCERHWEKAVEISRATQLVSTIERAISKRATGRARTLLDNRDVEPAIDLLQRALKLCKGPVKNELATKLADSFYLRAAFNSQKVKPSDGYEAWASIEEDLRSSFKHQPSSLKILKDFPGVLARNACDLLDSQPMKAGELLLEAWNVVVIGLDEFPYDEDVQKSHQNVFWGLTQVAEDLIVIGDRMAADDDDLDAFEHLWRAHEIASCDRRLADISRRLESRHEKICELALVAVIGLISQGEREEAGKLLERVLSGYSSYEASIPLHLLRRDC